VGDYLEFQNVFCPDVSEWVTLEDQVEIRESLRPGGEAYLEGQRLLAALDACVPDDFHEVLGIRHRPALFTGMFDYLLCVALWGKNLFERAIVRILEEEPATQIGVYEADESAPLFTPMDVLAALPGTRVPLTCIVSQSAAGLAAEPLPARRVWPSLRTLTRALTKHLRHDRSPDCKAKGSAPKQGTMLLLQPEGDLELIRTCALPLSLLIWPRHGLPEVAGVDLHATRNRAQNATKGVLNRLDAGGLEGVADSYWRRIRDDFAKHGEQRLTMLALVDELAKTGRVNAAAWGFSAGAGPEKNLMMQYLQQVGIPVAGMQHGGNYGIQNCGYLPTLDDYGKCARFFSYGFTLSDVPEKQRMDIPCEIVPVGCPRVEDADLIAEYLPRPGCVVYPLVDCLGLLSAARLSPASLAASQREVLAALDSRTDLDIWIKPFHGAAPKSLAIAERLRRMRHARLAAGTFTWFLRQKCPQLVIIDFPSSTLFESMPYDVDIFMLSDHAFPFTEEAERMMRDRVHVFDTAGEMAQAVRDYGRGPLPRLRSAEFAGRFLRQENAREHLVQAFTDWVGTWSRCI
jgi:hypothetical protein